MLLFAQPDQEPPFLVILTMTEASYDLKRLLTHPRYAFACDHIYDMLI